MGSWFSAGKRNRMQPRIGILVSVAYTYIIDGHFSLLFRSFDAIKIPNRNDERN